MSARKRSWAHRVLDGIVGTAYSAGQGALDLREETADLLRAMQEAEALLGQIADLRARVERLEAAAEVSP